MKKKISDKDKKEWEAFLSGNEKIIDKDLKKQANLNFKTTTIDLHGYSLEDANFKVKELILSCVEKNFKEILLITGKGIHSNTDNDIYSSKDLSKLRYSVPDFINSNSDISRYVGSISQADRDEGGEGAIIVKLKKL